MSLFSDDEFAKLLEEYPDPQFEPNPEMVDVEIFWVRNDPRLGVEHIMDHNVTRQEVEEVLLEVPPYVEARRSQRHPERTAFWGATRAGRWLFISCEDWTEGGRRYLKPITAFEPDEGEAYWRSQ